MCLSTVKRISENEEEILAEYVSHLRCSGPEITMTDIMGEAHTVSGRILNVDLINNVILVGD